MGIFIRQRTKEIDEHLGKQLREKRMKRGLTLSDVANELGISHQQVQKYELAQSRVSASTLYKFADLYNVRVEIFFKGLRQDQVERLKDQVINLLLVEDDPGDELLTRKSLEEFSNINVLCVHDGMQALEVLKYKTLCMDFPKPNLIFLDLNLPKRDGLSVLKDLKRDRSLMDIPTVVITNNLDTEVMQRAYSYGAGGYVCKSFDFSEYKLNIINCINYWIKTVSLPKQNM